VSAADIRRHLGEMWQEMNALERRIEELRAATQPLGHPVRTARTAAKRIKKAARKAISPERAESMRLQGRYLALLLKTRKSARAKFRKLAKERGRADAIAAMEKALDE
jgi:hypothetical protein